MSCRVVLLPPYLRRRVVPVSPRLLLPVFSPFFSVEENSTRASFLLCPKWIFYFILIGPYSIYAHWDKNIRWKMTLKTYWTIWILGHSVYHVSCITCICLAKNRKRRVDFFLHRWSFLGHINSDLQGVPFLILDANASLLALSFVVRRRPWSISH